MEIYLAAGNVDSISSGVYQYHPISHQLNRVSNDDVRQALYRSSLSQNAVKNAPASIVICGVYERTLQKYGQHGVRYVHIEVGRASQNIYLQCESLGLGTVSIEVFQDREIQEILGLKKGKKPLINMPVGQIK